MQYPGYDELHSLAELDAIETEWRALLQSLPEGNVFYSPVLLKAAIESGVQQTRWKVLAFREKPEGPLVGLLPVSARPPRRTWFLPHWGLLRHVHCYWCEPLLLPDFEPWVWSRMQGWLSRGFDLPWRGPAVIPTIYKVHEYENYSRAALDLPALGHPSYEDYLKGVLDSDARKKSRARERKAEARGELVYEEYSTTTDLESWLGDFLEVEASGWKGSSGTAIASQSQDRNYFISLCRATAAEGNLRLARLRLKETQASTVTTLAVRCAVVCNRREWTLKIGFRDAYKDLAPGVLLEHFYLRALCAAKVDRLIDSCSSPDNRMLNSLWNSRLEVRSHFVKPRNLYQYVYGNRF